MRRTPTHSSDVARTFDAPPETYVLSLSETVRSLALDGRGDDARGRHLAALHALEWAYEHDLFAYRPSRDPGRWLVLLVDVAGAHMGLAPLERLQAPVGTFLARLSDVGLERVASRTRETLRPPVADAFGAPPGLVEPLMERMSVAALCWILDVPQDGLPGREKHPQGRQIRKALRSRIDGVWDAQLAEVEAHRVPDAIDVLAAIPPSFEVAAESVAESLERVDERLELLPFAVFYALVTDARRGGRVWIPPSRYVEGGAYDRSAFESAVGHVLDASRSRRRRYRRSCVLAELGLSASFPRTVARIDRWLETAAMPEFRIAPGPSGYAVDDWYAWARSRATEIRARHQRLVDAFSA